jgi:alpha-galactosidase
MGWNSWNTFACEVSQDLMKSMADKVIELGLADLGYNYINLDDCWQLLDRNADGEM